MRIDVRRRWASRFIVGATAAATLGISLVVPANLASATTFPVTTDAPTLITGVSATLNGSAQPPNSTDSAYAYYCLLAGTGIVPGSNYPQYTTCNLDHTDITGATAPVSLPYPVTGLSPGTTYSYDVEAVDSTAGADSYGTVEEFTTPAAPAATTSAATAVTGVAGTINGSATANNNSAGAASAFFCVGATSAVTSTDGATCSNGTLTAASAPAPTGSSATSESATLGSLTAGSTTYYVLVVSNADTFTVSSVSSFTTSAAPAATTTAPISVTATSATIEGSATANNNAGPAATAFFCVASATGVTSADGSTCEGNLIAASNGAPTGSSATAESADIDGLASGSTYYYVLVVDNADTFTVSNETSFTTPVPPGATSSAATSVTGTTATMNGTATANNNAAPAASAFFCEGTTSGVSSSDGSTCSTGNKVAATPGSPTGSTGTSETGTLTGLTAGSTYYYVLVVANNDTFTVSTATSFTTPTPPGATISGPTAVAGTTATLHGSATANNNSGPAASAFFCLSTSSTPTSTNGTSCSIGTLESASAPSPTGSGATAEASSATGLSRGTTYYYVLVVSNSDTFTVSGRSSFTTPNYPNVTIDPATNVTAYTATLNGVTAANNYSGSNATSFFCYSTSDSVWSYNGTSCYDGTYVAASPYSSAGEGGTSESAGISGLTKGTTYYVILVAINGAGYSVSDQADFTTWTNPSAPSSLQVSTGATSITASWGAPVSDGGTPVTSYTCTLMFGFNDPSSFTVTTTSDQCSFYQLQPGSTWGIAVFATNVVGPSSAVQAFGTLPGPPKPPPHKPTIIHLVCVKGKHVRHVSGTHPHCPKGYHIRR